MISRRSLFPLLAGVAALGTSSANAVEMQSYDSATAQKLIASGAPVIVHVYAPWCLQCRAQASILNGVQSNPALAKVAFFRVDYDAQKDVVQTLDVPRSTLIAYKGGKEVSRMSWGTAPDNVLPVIQAVL